MTSNQNINSDPYAVVIGGANMDICGATSISIRLNDSNPGNIVSSPGGVARNIAENLALLKVKNHLLTAVGDDHFGQTLTQIAKDVGINMNNILHIKNEKTSTYLSVLDSSGEMVVAINDMSIIDHITIEYIQRNQTAISAANVIVADTNIPKDTLAYLIKAHRNIPIIIDTVSGIKALKIKDHLNGIHSLKTNRIEAEMLSGISNDLSKMADWFHQEGVKRIYITSGEDGVYYSGGNECGLITPRNNQQKVINVTGAGDAFTAGIVYAYIEKLSIMPAVQFGMAAATIALAHNATINPDLSVEKAKKIMEKEYDN